MTALERAKQIAKTVYDGKHYPHACKELTDAIYRAIIEHSEAPAAALVDLMAAAEKEKWCIVPPNQETRAWTVYRRFDGDFGYDDEIGNGLTMIDALTEALKALDGGDA